MTRSPSENDLRGTAADTPPVARTTSAQASELLAARRRWFSSFPEGPLEFVAAVRLLWILSLFVIPVIGGFLRTFGALGVSALLLADVGLTMWWLTQLVSDRDCWLGGEPIAPGKPAGAGVKPTAAVVVTQGLLFAFGASFLTLPFEAARVHPGVVAAVRWGLFAAHLVAIPLAVAACRAAGLRGRWCVVFFVVPFLHWWAARRFAADLGSSFAEQAGRRSSKEVDFSRAGFVFADVMWVVLILVIAADLLAGGMWSGMTMQGLCSALIIAVAAIADVAAMESTQRAYLAYLRAATQPTRS